MNLNEIRAEILESRGPMSVSEVLGQIKLCTNDEKCDLGDEIIRLTQVNRSGSKSRQKP